MPTQKKIKRIERVVAKRQADLVVVLEDVHDPHNAAAVFRCCDAFGVQEVCLIFDKEKYFNPKKIGKITSGSANKWLDFRIYRSTKEGLVDLKNQGFNLIAAALQDDAESLYKVRSWPKKTALLIGNEHRGLSASALELSDRVIALPMLGMVQSLNLSVTAGIFLYEITRDRGFDKKFRISPAAAARLSRRWLLYR